MRSHRVLPLGIVVVGAAIVAFRLAFGDRFAWFWIVGMTTFGVLQLLLIGALAVTGRANATAAVMHFLAGCGALIMAYSGIADEELPLLVTGAVLFSAGMLLFYRQARAARVIDAP